LGRGHCLSVVHETFNEAQGDKQVYQSPEGQFSLLYSCLKHSKPQRTWVGSRGY